MGRATDGCHDTCTATPTDCKAAEAMVTAAGCASSCTDAYKDLVRAHLKCPRCFVRLAASTQDACATVLVAKDGKLVDHVCAPLGPSNTLQDGDHCCTDEDYCCAASKNSGNVFRVGVAIS